MDFPIALILQCEKSRDGNGFQDLLKDLVGGQLGGFRLNAPNNPMTESRNGNFLHVGRQHVVPVMEKGHRFGEREEVVVSSR